MSRIIVFAALVSLGATATSEPMTDLDRQRLIAHLEMTAGWLLDEVSGLTEAQLRFRPKPGSWTIAEVLDHLIVVAPIYWQDLQAALKEPAVERGNSSSDVGILWYGIDRTYRERAIPSELPKGGVRDLQSALDTYRKHHSRLLDFARTTKADLRAHVVKRQSSDAYQWALLISTHEQRHILQIREIKSDARFPKK